MKSIFKFFTFRKTVTERLEKALKRIKNADFVILSRKDGIPVIMVSNKTKDSAILAAKVTSLTLTAKKVLKSLDKGYLKHIFLIGSEGSIALFLEDSLILAVGQRGGYTEKLIEKCWETIEKIKDILR